MKLVTPILHTALAVLVTACLAPAASAQPMERPDFEVTPEERDAVIDAALKAIGDNYVFPERAAKMQQAVRARVESGEYGAITSAKAFAEKLTQDLQEVSRDKHLHVMYDANGVPDRPGGPPTAEDLERARGWLQRVNFGFEKAERLPGNIGYVEIRGFVPPRLGAQTATAAMNFVAHADALIVDLRRNNGGEPAMIAYVLSYLFDEATHLNDIYERPTGKTQQWWTSQVPGPRYGGSRPVYVLTSAQTFSGGEEFAYNVKTLERGTIVGETTGGGAHPTNAHKIGDRFLIGVPFARAINPITGTNWEGTGVTPDVDVPADKALDTAVRLALEQMLETTTDPRAKQEIQKLLSKGS